MDITSIEDVNILSSKIVHNHALPGITIDDLTTAAKNCRRWKISSLWVLPDMFAVCCELLRKTSVTPATSIDYPFGQNSSKIRAAMVLEVLKIAKKLCRGENGEARAAQIELVPKQNYLAVEDWASLRNDLNPLVKRIHDAGSKAVLALEAPRFSENDLVVLTEMAIELGFDSIRTSSGILSSLTTLDNVKTIHRLSKLANMNVIWVPENSSNLSDLLGGLEFCDAICLKSTVNIMENASDCAAFQ